MCEVKEVREVGDAGRGRLERWTGNESANWVEANWRWNGLGHWLDAVWLLGKQMS